MTSDEPKIHRTLRPSDLAVLAGKKRQSPRTGFVHLFHGAEGPSDTIPVYENSCFALALLTQRKTETVLEARQLFLRLLAFQTEEGNFPIYLHDYPRCYDPHLGLRMAPLFLRALRDFGPVLGAECKEKIEASLRQIFSWVERRRSEKPLSGLLEFCYCVCKAVFEKTELPTVSFDQALFSASDWWDYWTTLQFIQTPVSDFYHPGVQISLGPFLSKSSQDRFEPIPELIDWICAQPFDERLSADRPSQIQLAALERVDVVGLNKSIPGWISDIGDSHALLCSRDSKAAVPILLFWKDGVLHSARLEVQSSVISSTLQEGSLSLQIELPAAFELQREALFEISLYVDASPDIELFIEGKKGTSFSIGDSVTFQSASLKGEISFELLEGEGDFCGHLFRSNRSNQKGAVGPLQYESFDWKIALRTLRRSERCTVGFRLTLV